MEFKTTYKGFDIEGLKVIKGFNQWTINITQYKYKGFKEEEYFLKIFNTYTSIKKDALKEVYNFIDNLKVIPYSSSGMINCPYLNSIKGVFKMNKVQKMKVNKRVFSVGSVVEDETGTIYIIRKIDLKGALLDNNVNTFYDVEEDINFLKVVA